MCLDITLVHKLVLLATVAAGLDIGSLWIMWQVAELYF